MNVIYADSLKEIGKGTQKGVAGWLWVVVIIILLLVVITIKNRLEAEKKKRNELEREQNREQNIRKIRTILDKHFSLFKEEIKKMRLYNFYSRQLDVKEYQKKYTYNTKIKKQLYSFDFTYDEIEIARDILKKELIKIFNGENFTINKMEYEMFLYDYYELIANREVLNQLKYKTENKKKWKKYYDENEKEIEDLIIRNSK